MAAKNPKAGRAPCKHCGEPVWYRRSAAGKLTASCDACGLNVYCDAGDRADRETTRALKVDHPQEPDDDVKPAPVPAPTPAPKGKPAAKAPRPAFGLAQL